MLLMANALCKQDEDADKSIETPEASKQVLALESIDQEIRDMLKDVQKQQRFRRATIWGECMERERKEQEELEKSYLALQRKESVLLREKNEEIDRLMSK